MDLPENIVLDETSESAKKFLGYGFEVERARCIDSSANQNTYIQLIVKCICGDYKVASVQLYPTEQKLNLYDFLAQELNRKHLLFDGFTEDQINQMEQNYAHNIQ